MAEEYRQHVFEVPKGATDLWLLRHGESEAARPGEPFPTVDGHGDPALHENGRRQAIAAGNRLAGEKFDALYVTTLRRTHETAAPLVRLTGLDARIERDLREVSLGDWDNGLYRQKAAERDPAFLRAFERDEWGEIPGAETTEGLHTRVRGALGRIALSHSDQKVLAVVHGGIIGAIMSLATGARPFAFNWSANCSISRIVLDGQRIHVRGFNDCTHLL